MSEFATAIYRCKRCGSEVAFASMGTASGLTDFPVIRITTPVMNEESPEFILFRAVCQSPGDCHQCADGGIGVMEFVGVNPGDTENTDAHRDSSHEPRKP